MIIKLNTVSFMNKENLVTTLTVWSINAFLLILTDRRSTPAGSKLGNFSAKFCTVTDDHNVNHNSKALEEN